MKRLLTVVFLLLMVVSLTVFAVAADYEVYAEAVKVVPNKTVEVPIIMKNNRGLMGFKLEVSWLPDQLDVVSVAKGELLKKGNYNTNFGNRDSCFDVLWNSTENVTEDGTLFVIEVKLKQTVKDEAKIKLSFSQPDTFNSEWKEITLKCSEITVKRSDEKPTEAVSAETTSFAPNVKAPALPSNEKIIEAYKAALKETEYDTVYEAAGHDDYTEKVNENLSQAVGVKIYEWVKGYDSTIKLYEQAYENVFFATVTESMDSEEVSRAVQEVLQKMGISSVSDIPKEKEAKFVKELQKKLNKINPDTPNAAEDVDTDEAMKLFKQTYGLVNGGVPQKVEVNERSDGRAVVIAVVGTVVIIAAATAIIIYKKKK